MRRFRYLIAGAAVAVGALVVPAHAAFAAPANEASEHCIKLLEDGKDVEDCQKAPSLIMPAKNEIVWGGIAFLIVFGALSKFAYPAIKKGMEDRTNKIRESIDEADRLKAEAATALAQHQASVADSKAEANRIVDEARQAAEAVRADIISRAEAEANEIKTKAREDVEAGKARAIGELQSQVGDLTIALAEKVVERSLDTEANRAFIDNYITNLGTK
ncbi:MAG: F-type H+-transporting ATPase subunit b [Actinomycetota bacterium]|jgi:F-type H+-transporting ATPase subunit b